jgi:hypothetical protein
LAFAISIWCSGNPEGPVVLLFLTLLAIAILAFCLALLLLLRLWAAMKS